MRLKKFTLMVVALLVSMATFAQKSPMKMNRVIVNSTGSFARSEMIRTDAKVVKNNTARRASRRALSSDVVTLPEDADIEYFKMTGKLIRYTASGWSKPTVLERTVKVAFDGDDVYISGLSYWCEESFVKGTFTDDTHVIFPQEQCMGEPATGVYMFFVGHDGNDYSDALATYDADKNSFTFTTANADCPVTDLEAGISGMNNYWEDVTVTKIEGEVNLPIEAPDDLVTEQYSYAGISYFTKQAVSHIVNVGFYGNEVYIQGMCEEIPEAWIKGTMEGDVVTFKTGQNLGKYGSYTLYFHGYNGGDDVEDAVFTYDADKKVFTAVTEMMVSYVENSWYDEQEQSSALFEYVTSITISKIVEQPAVPANPSILNMAFTTTTDNIEMVVNVSDVDGNGMLSEKLYYKFYYKDAQGAAKELTFSKDLYTTIESDLTEIPYVLDTKGISNSLVALLMDHSNWTEIGLQSIYKGGNETHESEVVWYTISCPIQTTLPEGLTVMGHDFEGTTYKSSEDVPFTSSLNMAFDGDDLYIQGFAADAGEPDKWVKGTKNSEGIYVFKAGQDLGINEDYDCRLFFLGYNTEEREVEDFKLAVDQENGIYKFVNVALVNATYTDKSYYYTWYNEDCTISIEGYSDDPVVAPEGLVIDEYTYKGVDYFAEEGEDPNVMKNVKIGFDGNDVYLQGIADPYLPEAWIKGKLQDGKITFRTGQCLGEYRTYTLWFVGTKGSGTENVVFDYDAANGVLTLNTPKFIAVTDGKASLSCWILNQDVTMTKIEEKVATPANPTIATVQEAGDDGWLMGFTIPTVDTDGDGLVSSKLSYQVFVNAGGNISPLTFTPETHTRLTEPMTIIPYGFTDQYDFYYNAIYFNELFSYDWDQVGIQSIYTGGGVEKKSEISWFTITKPVIAPEGLETETYNFSASAIVAGSEDGPEPYNIQVEVGFDGDDAYIQGLSPDASELWVKATKNAEGQYVVPANQYMGVLSIWGYTFPYYWTAVDAEGNMVDAVFSFDAEKARFTTTQTQVLNGAKDKLDPYITFTEVVIEKMPDVAATPADPTMEKVDFDVENPAGYNSLYCSVATVGTNEEVLITSKLFYTIWIEKNGEQKPYVFTAALYPSDFEEDVVEVPYSHDGYDVYKGGEIIYIEDDLEELQTWTKVGIQSIYYGGGECHKSNIVWLDNPVATGISSITADKLQKSEGAWYSVNGQRVAKPTQKGLYIHNGKKIVIK